MYAQNVHMQLRPSSTAQFTQTLEKEVIPLLRKQSGCKALWDECLAPYLRRRRLEEQPISRRTLEDVACLVHRGSFQTPAKRLGEIRPPEEHATKLHENPLFPYPYSPHAPPHAP